MHADLFVAYGIQGYATGQIHNIHYNYVSIVSRQDNPLTGAFAGMGCRFAARALRAKETRGVLQIVVVDFIGCVAMHREAPTTVAVAGSTH
jgi:hypothetical protein